MVHAMTADPWKLFAAVGDRLHQARRLALVPAARDVFDRLSRVPIPVCVSGAGPSLLAFEIDEEHTVPDDLGAGWTVLRPGVRATGYEISVES
jgi:homoserine kinase